jgi:WD40 repeat protein
MCLAFSPDGRLMASGGAEAGGGLVMLWNVASAQRIHQFQGHTDWVWSVAFSPDGKELASTGSDGTIRRWDVAQGRLLKTIDTAQAPKHWLAYSRNGRELITSESGGTLRVWERTSGAESRAQRLGPSVFFQPALSAAGRLIVAGIDRSIVLVEYPTLKTIRRFPASPVYGPVIAISPDGQRIASVDSNHVYLSTLDGTRIGTCDHAGSVESVAFSPDGRTLVTGDMNFEEHLWDVERCERRATFRGHDQFVEEVRFSPDGKTIASASDDGTVRLWRSASD